VKGVIGMGKENMTTVSIRISQEEKDKLQELAKNNDLSMSQIIRKALRLYLENN
jgi:predicted transcriptional regulator